MARAESLVGVRFGRLTVIQRVQSTRPRKARWLCRCDCGNEHATDGSFLRRGESRSCGCLKAEACAALGRRPGKRLRTYQVRYGPRKPKWRKPSPPIVRLILINLIPPPEPKKQISAERRAAKRSWGEMIGRCTNQAHTDYANYGGRGITICERWRNSFEAFLSDMGERPARMTLDRRNNALGYSPDNCRWATATEQNQNSRQCKLTATDVMEILRRLSAGEAQSLIARSYSVTAQNIAAIRIGRSWRNVPRPLPDATASRSSIP